MRKHLLVALALALSIQTSANAVTGYRYWSFWLAQDGAWEMAAAGSATTPATAGTVQGWRFITGAVEVSADLAPRIAPDFTEICAANQTETHIGVVIDYGNTADYSSGEVPPEPSSFCVETNPNKTAIMVLSEITEIREEAGFICALNDLPQTGCAEPVTTETESAASNPPSEAPESGSNLLVNLVVLGFIAIGYGIIRKKFQKNE